MFYQVDAFPFVKNLKADWTTIRDEFLAGFDTSNSHLWPQSFVFSKEWKLVPLIDHGRMAQHGAVGNVEELQQNQQRFPKTVALLNALPGITTAGFSRLVAGSEIYPHKGIDHSVLRLHIGLITPPDCAINVHGQLRGWTEGCVFLFDDTYAHEVWNRSDAARVICIVDLNKRELEKAAGRPLDELLEPRTPEEVERGDDLETRWEDWQKKYDEAEPEPDWDKIFDYDVEDK